MIPYFLKEKILVGAAKKVTFFFSGPATKRGEGGGRKGLAIKRIYMRAHEKK